MESKKVSFKNHNGHSLSAYIDTPDSETPEHYALLAHCFTCSKNYKTFSNIDRALTENGFGVLRFDFTGLGESEGKFSDTNFTSNTDDLRAAADFMEKEFRAPELLIGHSFGGAAVLQATSSIASSVAVATIAAPCDPAHINKLLPLDSEEMKKKGETEVIIAGRSFRIKKQFLDDLWKTDTKKAIRGLNRALIVFHSPLDRIVGIDNAADIFQTAKHPKSFISLDRADHLLSDPRDAGYVGAITAVWASKYITQTS